MTDAKKTRALTPAPNAAARMQELLREKAREGQQEDEGAAVQEAYSNTQMSTHSNEEGFVLKTREEHATGIVTGAAATAPPSVLERDAVPPIATRPLRERVAERLVPRADKEATVRLSIDVSERLHERIKVYCARNKTTTRAVTVALLEALMDEVGE